MSAPNSYAAALRNEIERLEGVDMACDQALGLTDADIRKVLASTGSVKPEEADRIVERHAAVLDCKKVDHECVGRAVFHLGNALLELQKAILVANPVERLLIQTLQRQLFPAKSALSDLENALSERGRSR